MERNTQRYIYKRMDKRHIEKNIHGVNHVKNTWNQHRDTYGETYKETKRVT